MRLQKPWLWLPSDWAHYLGPYALPILSFSKSRTCPEWDAFTWRNLTFRNRLGIAGGVDKTGKSVESWWRLGPGFVEIGTITPVGQIGNPGKIMDRDLRHLALWNRMGFPNPGMQQLKKVLSAKTRPYPTPLFVNIGKNRTTANENAVEDYLRCLQELNDLADVFVINISSPNTEGLRALQQGESFKRLIGRIADFKAQKKTKPIVIKLSPDITDEQLGETLAIGLDHDVDGWILTNTTQGRTAGMTFPKEGGVSGAPLSGQAKTLLKKTVEFLGTKKKDQLLISVGGVLNATDVKERLALGADLVQVFSALVFSGPYFFLHTLEQLKKNDSRTI